MYHRIFFMMIVIGIIPIVVAGMLALYSVTYSHRLNVSSLEDGALDQKSKEIQNFISEVADIFKLQVGYEQVSEIEKNSQHFLLTQMFHDMPVLEDVSFVNLAGRETTRHTLDAPNGVAEEFLRDESRLPSFKTAANGNTYFGQVYYTERGPRLTLASPVRNKNGVIISVISGEISLNKIQEILQRPKLGATGYVYVADANGQVLAKSNSKDDFKNVRNMGLVQDTLMGKSFWGPASQRRYESIFGESVVAAATYIPNLQWALVAEWPIADADLILDTLLAQVAAVFLVVMVGAILLSLLLSAQIVEPIQVLEQSAAQVATGNFKKRVVIATHDEIEELGNAFNKMTDGLEQLQQLKNEFVFIAAHELRTPVAAIKGYLSLIKDGTVGHVEGKVLDFINKVMDANERLIRLVDDLLEIARSDAGRLTIEVMPIELLSPIQSVLSELQPLADEKSIKLIYEQMTLPKVLADVGRVKEVVVNLVGNAIKYTIGSGTVTITHELQDQMVVTHIKDTGLGISKEDQEKLFQKFYRVATEQTKNIKGTGLGLFIVKQIIEKMNGKIWVESKEGEGSTFSFSLQIAQV